MTLEQLQTISRELARLLEGTEVFPYQWIIGPDRERTGALHNWRDVWLHESTEACAEIMVRVLGHISYQQCGDIHEFMLHGLQKVRGCTATQAGDDPMQAFRTAVCLAAIEVLKGK